MKGILLAAGAGTRLYPASQPISKILLSIYDKPMIYYPLSTLMLAGIKEILIITNENDYDNFVKLLHDGSQLGLNISYKIQYEQRGIADAFIIARDFINHEPVVLILGDNIFYGDNFVNVMKRGINKNRGATIFAYSVPNPESFGVVKFDENLNVLSLEEKPKKPESNYAVTGLYIYDENVCDYALKLKPSKRGELEITDINKIYLENGKLNLEIFGKGFAWFDTGTIETMFQASNFVRTIELNTGVKISCLEEIALNLRYVTKDNLLQSIYKYKDNNYYNYIMKIISNYK